MSNIYTIERFPVEVKFTRNFKRGFHKGHRIADSLPFVSMESAQRWIDGIRKNERVLDFKLEDVTMGMRAA